MLHYPTSDDLPALVFSVFFFLTALNKPYHVSSERSSSSVNSFLGSVGAALLKPNTASACTTPFQMTASGRKKKKIENLLSVREDAEAQWGEMHSAKWSDDEVQPQVYKVDSRVNLFVLVEMKC